MDRVIYRTDPEGDVVAFLPDVDANPGAIVCYAHVGQHSEACFAYYRDCKPAKPEAYQSLHAELTGIYGRLDIYHRLTNGS